MLSGMGGGSGFLSFLVAWFLAFSVCCFVGVLLCCFLFFGGSWFLLSWFQSSKVSKIYQVAISCFFIDSDFISKIFKILLSGSSGFVGAHLFQNRQSVGFPQL